MYEYRKRSFILLMARFAIINRVPPKKLALDKIGTSQLSRLGGMGGFFPKSCLMANFSNSQFEKNVIIKKTLNRHFYLKSHLAEACKNISSINTKYKILGADTLLNIRKFLEESDIDFFLT